MSEKTYQPVKIKSDIDSYPLGPEQFALADKLLNRIADLQFADSKRTSIAEFFGILAAHTQKLGDERMIEHDKAVASHARKEALMTRNLPFDAFVVRYGGDGFGSEIVVGRDAANRAFAKLHSDDETDEMYEVYLKMAQDDDNWHFGADGEISDLTVDHECGWADIRRITLPAPITSELSKP